jgi:hypothetical protein
MELTVLIVTIVLGLIGLYVTWWVPTETQIKQELRDAEPKLSFTTSCYGGPDGQGFSLDLYNQGNVSAYNLSLYFPGIDNPAWQTPDLSAHARTTVKIPLAVDASIRTYQMEELTLRLVYHNCFEQQFVASLDLIQQPRADGFYNVVGAPQGPTITRPIIRFQDLWRLRKRI